MNITVGHQILEKGLLPDLGPDFWELKRQNLLTVHKAYEAVYNSLYGLIHLAVRLQHSQTLAALSMHEQGNPASVLGDLCCERSTLKIEAKYRYVFSGPMHMQVMGGSISAVRFLVNKGYADVNAPAAESGLTPLMCAALCRSVISRVSTFLSQPWSSHCCRDMLLE